MLKATDNCDVCVDDVLLDNDKGEFTTILGSQVDGAEDINT